MSRKEISVSVAAIVGVVLAGTAFAAVGRTMSRSFDPFVGASVIAPEPGGVTLPDEPPPPVVQVPVRPPFRPPIRSPFTP